MKSRSLKAGNASKDWILAEDSVDPVLGNKIERRRGKKEELPSGQCRDQMEVKIMLPIRREAASDILSEDVILNRIGG